MAFHGTVLKAQNIKFMAYYNLKNPIIMEHNDRIISMGRVHKDLFNALSTFRDVFTLVPFLNKVHLNI